MHIRSSLRRIIRNLNLALHLTIETTLSVIASLRIEWRKAAAGSRLSTVVSKLPRIVSYYVGWAVDPHDYFAIDGDGKGRRRSRLNPAEKRQRRNLSDRRRRRVDVLLRALGGTPQQVQANLTRQWLIGRADHSCGLVEDYLSARLRHSDPHGMRDLLVFRWVCNVGGTWVATPAPLRRYLAGTEAHRRTLESSSHLPRRGPRTLTDAAGERTLATIRRCRCCVPAIPTGLAA